jgi:hypothetical protein
METQNLFKLLHVASVGFFGGSLLTMLIAQMRVQTTDAGERLATARLLQSAARMVVNPLAILGFLSGLLYWAITKGQYGSRIMACSPVYVHIMLGAGLLAVGFTQVWKARTRKLVDALERGAEDQARAHLARGWTFALLALFFVSTAFAVATLRVPNQISAACFKDFPRDRD